MLYSADVEQASRRVALKSKLDYLVTRLPKGNSTGGDAENEAFLKLLGADRWQLVWLDGRRAIFIRVT